MKMNYEDYHYLLRLLSDKLKSRGSCYNPHLEAEIEEIKRLLQKEQYGVQSTR